MIKKTLVVTIQEVNPHNKADVNDVMRVLRGSNSDNIVLETMSGNNGKLVVEKKDLYAAITEIEVFYNDKKTSELPNIVVESIPANVIAVNGLGIEKELSDAQAGAYIPATYGDDE